MDDRVTQIMQRVADGDESSDVLLTLLYDELLHIASRVISKENSPTITRTELLHEAAIKVLNSNASSIKFENRKHFFAASGKVMRNIMIDRARARRASKRGGDKSREELFDVVDEDKNDEMLAMKDSLERLEKQFPELANIVNLRYFAGMTNASISEGLDLSEAKVSRMWKQAKQWLQRDMGA